MLSRETEALFCELLIKLIEGEKAVEIQRNILAQDYSFNPSVAFRCLDSLKLHSLIPKSFQDFLSSSRPDLTETELYLLIKQYSQPSNGRLFLEDFYRLVLPSTNPTLFDLAVHRKSLKFTYSQEYALVRLLEKEVDLQVHCEKIKQVLYATKGFSIWKAFKTIDLDGFGVLTERQVLEFARQHAHHLQFDDFDALIRRISTGNTQEIEYNEFLEFMLPVYSQELSKHNPSFEATEESFHTPVKQSDAKERTVEVKALFREEGLSMKEVLTELVQSDMIIESLRQLVTVQFNSSIETAMDFFSKGQLLTPDQFSKALNTLNVSFDQQDIDRIFERYGSPYKTGLVLDESSLEQVLFPEHTKRNQGQTTLKFTKIGLNYVRDLLNAVIARETLVAELKRSLPTNCDLTEQLQRLDEDSFEIIPELSDKETRELLIQYLESPQGQHDLQRVHKKLIKQALA